MSNDCSHSPVRLGSKGQCLDCRAERKKNRKLGIPNAPRGRKPLREDGWTPRMSEAFKMEKRKEANGNCAMCHQTGVTNLVADHNHAICPEKSHACPKCFRGMICRSCNGSTIDYPEGQGAY